MVAEIIDALINYFNGKRIVRRARTNIPTSGEHFFIGLHAPTR